MQIKSYLKNKAITSWNFASVKYSIYKRHKSIFSNGEIERLVLTDKEKKEYRAFWKPISSIINLETVEITKSLTGYFNKYIVPEEFYPLYFEKYFNNDKSVGFLQNKSVYNKWFDKGLFPKDFFHKIDSVYYTYDFNIIDDIEDYISKYIFEDDFPLVIKPNKDSYGGADIYFVNSKNDIKNTIMLHDDLVVQEKVEQSRLINDFNKDSINTIRVCLYKDEKGLSHILNTSIRMGKNGSLDNETAGGIVCNIKSNGTLNKYAVDKYARKYFEHPNSGFLFENKKLPFYRELEEVSIHIAQKIIGVRLISLDMALDSNNNWRCIETNLFGQTIRFAQYAGEPFFGILTDKIMNDLKKYKDL